MDSILFSPLPLWEIYGLSPLLVQPWQHRDSKMNLTELSWRWNECVQRKVLVELWQSLERKCQKNAQMKGRPEGTLLRKAGDLFLSLLLCSDKASCLPIKWKWEVCGEWMKPVVWALGLYLHVELTPTHLCYPEEKTKEVNDEMSGRHLGVFRNTH